jgi:FAD binding domain/Berberine and berberine like
MHRSACGSTPRTASSTDAPSPLLADVTALDAAIEGRVILPDSAEYESLRRPAWAQYADVRPELVVRCRAPADVAQALAFARRSGLEAAVRGGGHCFAGRSTTRGLLIDLSPMSAVTLSNEVAVVGAGALLGGVYEELELQDRTIAAGSCPSVGIAGLTLGGGLGILGRQHGLTSDQLVAVELVLANGRIVVCDTERHPDLFWALRGAGGEGFGVVTSLAFRTVPADDLTCFQLVWPYSDAAALLDVWQSWAPRAPDQLAASLLLNAPADRDRPLVVTLFGASSATEEETERLLDELVVRAGGEPASASLDQLVSGGAKRYLMEHAPGAEPSGDEEAASLAFSKSEFFHRPLPREAITALVDNLAIQRVSGQARELDFTPWGGAYNRVSPQATAFVHRDELFLLKHSVALPAEGSTDDQELGSRWLARSWALVHGFGSGRVFPNFPDPDLPDPGRAYYGANRDRLVEIAATHDPENLSPLRRREPR